MNIIVQAGGKGTRLRHHTWNKPKCLVSINGKPIIYHLFEKFKDDSFFIIGDYMFETIQTYLKFNDPKVRYDLIKSNGSGNCSGISEALKLINNSDPILIVWSDLLINENINFDLIKNTTIFTSSSFETRYGIDFDNNIVFGEPQKSGIIGLFYFNNKNHIISPPNDGEYVDWFSENHKSFEIYELSNVDELGDYSHYEDQISIQAHCRFFNDLKIQDSLVYKKCIIPKFEKLISYEQTWYQNISDIKFTKVPKIYSKVPYCMERIYGKHPFELEDVSNREKSVILINILDTLKDLHSRAEAESNTQEVEDVYINKTILRLQSVENLIKNNIKNDITINGIKCKNYNFDDLINKISSLSNFFECDKFYPIHGDSTFSNILIDKYLRSWLIDPRGYFSQPGIWGDYIYDYSKLYYSVFGNYDKFNRRNFKLFMNDNSVEIMIEDNIFKNIRNEIFDEYFSEKELFKIKLIHSLIWFSLSGYVLDDLDSIYASYYLGLYWLEKTLN